MNLIFCNLKKPQKTWISFVASLKTLKKHEFHFFASLKNLKKDEFHFFCKLKKLQKAWISFFASLKNFKKDEFHFLHINFFSIWKKALLWVDLCCEISLLFKQYIRCFWNGFFSSLKKLNSCFLSVSRSHTKKTFVLFEIQSFRESNLCFFQRFLWWLGF